ncbi:fumarylacetoacetate hydrolase family protein [Microbacteriaceae bacterium K1510]|nr:fumarylacetoacetate hydrolase family protein [Microbacteriaceae bacterium K1510]
MRLCRYGQNRLGVLHDGLVHDVTDVLSRLGSFAYPLPAHDVFISRFDELRPSIEAACKTSKATPFEELSLLSPVANPGKLVAAPVNYIKHLEEAQADRSISFGQQIQQIQKIGLFLKANSSLVGAGEGVALRFPDRRNDHEIELAAVIGHTADRISAKDALNYVFGYCIGLDMTVRGPEERSLRKSIDTYSVLGPILITSDELGDPSALDMELTVNGEIRQKANTRDLVLSLPELIEYASRFYTLHPGDVIFTGTPEGVAPVKPGDTICAKIAGIGEMTVNVRSA